MGSQVAAAESLEAPHLKYRTDLSSEQKQTVRCDASAPAECEGHRLIAFEDSFECFFWNSLSVQLLRALSG
jgi:hypothetical protein